MHRTHAHRKLLTTKMDSAHRNLLPQITPSQVAAAHLKSCFGLKTILRKIKTIKMFYFIFSGLSLFTLVIVCVAVPIVDSETTETREGKGKF